MFFLIVEYRPNTNIVILWKIGHAKGGHIWERVKEWSYEGECGWCTQYTRMNLQLLNFWNFETFEGD
jgi:hypothetical protein